MLRSDLAAVLHLRTKTGEVGGHICGIDVVGAIEGCHLFVKKHAAELVAFDLGHVPDEPEKT